jgi:hypothetical protein
VSKTFKALQRAAKERAAKIRQGHEEPQPREPSKPAPTAGAARIIALEKAQDATSTITPPQPQSPPVVPGRPSGEMDSGLRGILEEALSPLNPELRIGHDGWLKGELDPETCRQLLAKFALLHCLRQDAENSYWFWGSKQESEEMAERSGLELDPF